MQKKNGALMSAVFFAYELLSAMGLSVVIQRRSCRYLCELLFRRQIRLRVDREDRCIGMADSLLVRS
jgi:hypothetical protein